MHSECVIVEGARNALFRIGALGVGARQCLLNEATPVVIEAGELAAGASGRNAGFLMTGLADAYETLVATWGRDRARAISLETSQLNLREVVTEVLETDAARGEVDLEPCGSVIAAWSDDEAERLARSAALLSSDGFDVELLDSTDVKRRVGSRRFRNGIAVAEDCGVHPVKLVRRLGRWVHGAGGRILERHEVRAISRLPNGTCAVATSKGMVYAARVVIATNAYARQLDPYFADKVRPVRGQALAMAARPGMVGALFTPTTGSDMRDNSPTERWSAGGSRRPFAESEVGFADETSADVQRGIEAFVREAWPETESAEVTHRWSGVMGFSRDGLPIVGVLPHQPKVAFAVGFTGHGLGFAFAAAHAVWNVLSGEGDAGIFAPRPD